MYQINSKVICWYIPPRLLMLNVVSIRVKRSLAKSTILKHTTSDVINKFPSKTNAVCVGLVVTTTSLKRCCNLIVTFMATDAETAGQFDMEELMLLRPREYNDDVMFFFKPYDRGKKDDLRYVVRFFAKGIRKLYASDQEIELYEVCSLNILFSLCQLPGNSCS
ncbi:hypothetical protein RDI58_021828 [Solanum bulbocastanum]|uniref:Uncharacterized protein n=1 Tax=Solanum bulbocastanum TaxID=147425 RepID=A0AAN8T4P7_SOLBU